MRNKGHTQLVRGGQTTQHWTRMATQVVKYCVTAAAAVYAITLIILVVRNYEVDKAWLTGIYWLAEFNVEQKGSENLQLRFFDLDGQRVTRTTGQIYADQDLRYIYELYSSNAYRFVRISFIPAAMTVVIVLAIFVLVGRSLKQEEHIRGARLVSPRDLKAWSRQK
ncbi:hypothetical protein [uncultured Tateyamaria sp.]|uniref:hypothetical protein n=1 Tax=uncultured Tateyamaria sp. TaxID=455651 RepID=UPI0026399292|nr:hypothetical protein [uncultured Tateyamaria sp.]